jgi:hypothetical protein
MPSKHQAAKLSGLKIMDYLEACIGISPIYDLNLREIRALVEAPKHSVKPSQPMCIVFTVHDERNSLFKLLRIISTFAKIRVLRKSFSDESSFFTKTYGIYPTINHPIVVFEMQSHAEEYVVEKILPEGPSGLNGYLRLTITRLTKINPTLGGVALVIRAKA